jgi:glutathione S-transferase
LFGVPASHPSLTAELMLRRKGISYERIDLIAAVHKPLVRAFGFPGMTVPALLLDGQHLQGSRTISRALDVLVPEPPLFPRDPERRSDVERAELWGDLVLQPAARRLAWAALKRDHSTIGTLLEGARTGIPLDSVDALVDRGVVGGPEPNAADYQLATSLRLMMALDDLRPLIQPRPAGRMALDVVPEFGGRIGPVYPAEWLPAG